MTKMQKSKIGPKGKTHKDKRGPKPKPKGNPVPTCFAKVVTKKKLLRSDEEVRKFLGYVYFGNVREDDMVKALNCHQKQIRRYKKKFPFSEFDKPDNVVLSQEDNIINPVPGSSLLEVDANQGPPCVPDTQVGDNEISAHVISMEDVETQTTVKDLGIDHDATVDKLKATVAKLMEQIRTLQMDIETLQNQSSKKQQEINDTRATKNIEHKTTVAKLTEQIVTLQGDINTLQNQSKMKQQEINDIRANKNIEHNTTVAELQTTVAELQDQIGTLQGGLERLQNQSSKKQEELSVISDKNNIEYKATVEILMKQIVSVPRLASQTGTI